MDMYGQIKEWMDNKKLLTVCFGHGKNKKEIIGRIINFDSDNILVYHDDEKQIYNISLAEVIDIKEAITGKRLGK